MKALPLVVTTFAAALALGGGCRHSSGPGTGPLSPPLTIVGLGTGRTLTEATRNAYVDAREKLSISGLRNRALIPQETQTLTTQPAEVSVTFKVVPED